MENRNDADRREALSRKMRQTGRYGGGRYGSGMAARTGSRNIRLFGMVFVLLLCAGLAVWSYAGHKNPFYILVGDQSAKDPNENEAGETPPEGLQNKLNGTTRQEGQEQKPYEVPEMVRVLLMSSNYSSIYHDTLVLKGTTGDVAITAAELREKFDETKEKLLQEGMILENSGECYMLAPNKNDQGENEQETAGEQLCVLSMTRACGSPPYRGCLYIYLRNEQFVLVNELTLEEYLYGVLPSEMPASYHNEALKAQAVCARTYACAVMENPRYPEYNAQLDDSTSCQVYGNLAEHESTTSAVEETKGEILLFEGRPVSTYYYSTSGGIGSSIGVWQGFTIGEYPYLSNRSQNAVHEELQLSSDTEFAAYLAAGHDDIESGYPWYRWSCQVSGIDADAVYEKLKERYAVKQEGVELVGTEENESKKEDGAVRADMLPHPGRIRMLSIEKRNPSGCAVCLLVEGEQCSYRVYGEYNVRYLLCDGNTTVTRQDGSTTVMSTILPSAYVILTPILDKEELLGYSIIGGGYGHGVGMSQNGADALAASGSDYRDILAYYYIGTELKK